MRRPIISTLATLALVLTSATASTAQTPAPSSKPMFASPHAAPVALSPTLPELYVVNTPNDTVDVIDTSTGSVVASVVVGVDPVSLAVRPDGNEVWASNHISDNVSVIDTDPASPTRFQVIGTITDWDTTEGWATAFDEPSGIAFASNSKAYVALSTRNQIAVVDVDTRTVTSRIQVKAQDPRAIQVRDGYLYVIPFESNNQTEMSGCLANPGGPNAPEDCTFNLLAAATSGIDFILTRNMTADIVANPDIPDRDLFVYDTSDDSLLHEISTLGTLLYGVAIDSSRQVWIANTDARNHVNGKSGTLGHDLIDYDNRLFINQLSVVDCSVDCSSVTIVDLEPAPPLNPDPGNQLAMPFGIQISDDDTTVVSVAAASSRLFTTDAATQTVLGTVDVGSIPRGLALESDGSGAPQTAYVFNALANSVSVVDVSTPTSPVHQLEIPLVDPTDPDIRDGRIAFNDAAGSTTGTFACSSCHPDGNTDHLLWNLGARCQTEGCDQVQPRSTMPIRGLRFTEPLHWDGVVGDPYGGINGEVNGGFDEILSGENDVPPNCSDEISCFRDLVDGGQSGTMCDQTGCPTGENELGLAGAFDEHRRDSMAKFLMSVSFPPARSRRLDDQLTSLAQEGFHNFLIGYDEADRERGCSRFGACHKLPLWEGTNTPGSGFDAPTFRGVTDRWLLTPSGRANMWAVQSRGTQLNEVVHDPNDGPDELFAWGATFGTEAIPLDNRASSGAGPFAFFQFFDEGSVGFSATYGKQVTLNQDTAASQDTLTLLARLEEADDDGVVNLHADGIRLDGSSELILAYDGGRYMTREGSAGIDMSSAALLEGALNGEHVVTVTARLGTRTGLDHPQPHLWLEVNNRSTFQPDRPMDRIPLQRMPTLTDDTVVSVFGRHFDETATVLVDGGAVGASLSCENGGALPSCDEQRVRITLDEMPAPLAATTEHTLQVVNPGGLISNEIMVRTPVCGNGLVDTGELCDGGAGCTPCVMRGSCPLVPYNTCTAAADAASSLAIKDGDAKALSDPQNAKDQIKAKLVPADGVASSGMGDLDGLDDVTFCLYDADGLVFGVDVTPGSPLWKCKDKPGKEQCKYKNKTGNRFGVKGLALRAGAAGIARAQIKIGARNVASPQLPLSESGPVLAQISTSAGICMEATFAPPFKKNDPLGGKFSAKN